jgi:hypothetical protein
VIGEHDDAFGLMPDVLDLAEQQLHRVGGALDAADFRVGVRGVDTISQNVVAVSGQHPPGQPKMLRSMPYDGRRKAMDALAHLGGVVIAE